MTPIQTDGHLPRRCSETTRRQPNAKRIALLDQTLTTTNTSWSIVDRNHSAHFFRFSNGFSRFRYFGGTDSNSQGDAPWCLRAPRGTPKSCVYPPGHPRHSQRLPPAPESSHSVQKPSRKPELCWNFFGGAGIFFSQVGVHSL